MDVSRVSRERIASLDDAGLNTLMSDLLRAHAYRSNGSEAQVRTNTDLKAGDDGCDGWTPAPRVRDDWFAGEPMCWQFKAGTAEKRNNSDHRKVDITGFTNAQASANRFRENCLPMETISRDRQPAERRVCAQPGLWRFPEPPYKTDEADVH